MSALSVEPGVSVNPPPKADKFAALYSGVHPSEDRDSRFAVKVASKPRKLWNMIRVRVPIGTLSADQYLALDDLAESVTYNRSLRVTTGQSIQLHGVSDSALDRTISGIERAGLAAGCHPSGLEFAVAVPPSPIESESYRRLRALGLEICEAFYPKPNSGQLPFPGHSPRKFAIGLGLVEDNSVNVVANDVGLLLVQNREGAWRVNVFAGGSLSMPTKRSDTYARLATPLGSVRPDHVLAVIEAIAIVFAKHGNLATRRHTRLKYVVDEMGTKPFRQAVERELGWSFAPLIHVTELASPAWSGAREQGDGDLFYGLNLPYGRIRDEGLKRYKSAIRLIVETFRPRVVLSPDQNLVFAGLQPDQVLALERILAAYHVPHGKAVSNVRFESMACAGLPTCPLAVAESERVAGPLLEALEAELKRIGRVDSPFGFRISGCSIGCIRPNMVDLGAIGRKPGHYDLYVGGSESAGQFGELYAETVPLHEIISTVRPLLDAWGRGGKANESFSAFYTRVLGSGEKPMRLVSCDAVPARERIERMLAE